MRQPILYVAGWSFFVLVIVLPVQAAFVAEKINQSKETFIPRITTEEGSNLHDLNQPLLTQHGENPHHEEKNFEAYHDQSRPLTPPPKAPSKYNPFRNMKFTKLKNFLQIDLPDFIKKIFKFMIKDSVTVHRLNGKTLRMPYYAFRLHHKLEWEMMDQDISTMVEAQKSFKLSDLLSQANGFDDINSRLLKVFEDPPKPKTAIENSPKSKEAIENSPEPAEATEQSVNLPEAFTFIADAGAELKRLKGTDAYYETEEKKKRILLVKSFLILSEHPQLRQAAIDEIHGVITFLDNQARHDPKTIPRMMNYIRAAHQVMSEKEIHFAE